MKPKAKSGPRMLDVRPLFAADGEPFATIMSTVADLHPTEDLILITPFLPSPMIEKLQADGFVARPERRTDGAWQTYFQRRP